MADGDAALSGEAAARAELADARAEVESLQQQLDDMLESSKTLETELGLHGIVRYYR